MLVCLLGNYQIRKGFDCYAKLGCRILSIFSLHDILVILALLFFSACSLSSLYLNLITIFIKLNIFNILLQVLTATRKLKYKLERKRVKGSSEEKMTKYSASI